MRMESKTRCWREEEEKRRRRRTLLVRPSFPSHPLPSPHPEDDEVRSLNPRNEEEDEQFSLDRGFSVCARCQEG